MNQPMDQILEADDKTPTHSSSSTSSDLPKLSASPKYDIRDKINKHSANIALLVPPRDKSLYQVSVEYGKMLPPSRTAIENLQKLKHRPVCIISTGGTFSCVPQEFQKKPLQSCTIDWDRIPAEYGPLTVCSKGLLLSMLQKSSYFARLVSLV
jgi:hypothetical protein